jgi:hypothetical protein
MGSKTRNSAARRRLAVIVAGLIACSVTADATARTPQHSTHPTTTAVPSAAEFARDFVELVNGFANAQADFQRIANLDCVQASRRRYMCSYLVTRPGRRGQCHIMQAQWTPDRTSTITVTLSGRTQKCASLRQALHWLR